MKTGSNTGAIRQEHEIVTKTPQGWVRTPTAGFISMTRDDAARLVRYAPNGDADVKSSPSHSMKSVAECALVLLVIDQEKRAVDSGNQGIIRDVHGKNSIPH